MVNAEREAGLLLMTAKQAAEALGISQRKLWSLTASGEICHVRIGRLVRYPIDELQAFIVANKQGGEVRSESARTFWKFPPWWKDRLPTRR